MKDTLQHHPDAPLPEWREKLRQRTEMITKLMEMKSTHPVIFKKMGDRNHYPDIDEEAYELVNNLSLAYCKWGFHVPQIVKHMSLYDIKELNQLKHNNPYTDPEETPRCEKFTQNTNINLLQQWFAETVILPILERKDMNLFSRLTIGTLPETPQLPLRTLIAKKLVDLCHDNISFQDTSSFWRKIDYWGVCFHTCLTDIRLQDEFARQVLFNSDSGAKVLVYLMFQVGSRKSDLFTKINSTGNRVYDFDLISTDSVLLYLLYRQRINQFWGLNIDESITSVTESIGENLRALERTDPRKAKTAQLVVLSLAHTRSTESNPLSGMLDMLQFDSPSHRYLDVIEKLLEKTHYQVNEFMNLRFRHGLEIPPKLFTFLLRIQKITPQFLTEIYRTHNTLMDMLDSSLHEVELLEEKKRNDVAYPISTVESEWMNQVRSFQHILGFLLTDDSYKKDYPIRPLLFTEIQDFSLNYLREQLEDFCKRNKSTLTGDFEILHDDIIRVLSVPNMQALLTQVFYGLGVIDIEEAPQKHTVFSQYDIQLDEDKEDKFK